MEWGIGTGGGRGLDEALNKSSQQPVTLTWRGPRAYGTNGSVITSIICNKLRMSKYSICIKDNFVRWEAKLPAAGNLKSGTISLEDGTNIWTQNDRQFEF